MNPDWPWPVGVLACAGIVTTYVTGWRLMGRPPLLHRRPRPALPTEPKEIEQ